MPNFNLNFNHIPITEERLEDWRIYCYLWNSNNWTDPGYYLGRWVNDYGTSSPEFCRVFDKWMTISHSSSGTQVHK